MQKKIITYQDYGDLLNRLVERIKNIDIDCVFGIPRGGLPIAVHVSHHKKVNLVDHELVPWDFYQDKNMLIVDDIIDTGETIKNANILFENHAKKITFASLFKRPSIDGTDIIWIEESPDWIVFPYELVEELPSTYHQGVYSDLFSKGNENVL